MRWRPETTPVVSPVNLARLAPSLFLSSLLFLKLAKLSTLSTSPHLATLSMYVVVISHLDPKLLARKVKFSLVCDAGTIGEKMIRVQ